MTMMMLMLMMRIECLSVVASRTIAMQPLSDRAVAVAVADAAAVVGVS